MSFDLSQVHSVMATIASQCSQSSLIPLKQPYQYQSWYQHDDFTADSSATSNIAVMVTTTAKH